MAGELNTFGGVLSYGMEIESGAAAWFARTAEEAEAAGLRRLLAALAADALKRRESLERLRRENVTEMILTPIHDFDAADYTPDFAHCPDDTARRAAARAIAETRARYYDTAQAKTEIAEVGRALARLARGNRQHMSDIDSAV